VISWSCITHEDTCPNVLFIVFPGPPAAIQCYHAGTTVTQKISESSGGITYIQYSLAPITNSRFSCLRTDKTPPNNMDSSICKKSKNRHERQIEIETQKHMQTFRDTHPKKKKGKGKKKSIEEAKPVDIRKDATLVTVDPPNKA